MIKRIITMALAVIFLSSNAVTAMASDPATHRIPGEGQIYAGDTANIIELEIPSSFLFVVNESTKYYVESAEYTIKNKSKYVDLRYMLKSFKQTNNVVLPGTLTLNLADDLVDGDVHVGWDIVGFDNINNLYYGKKLLKNSSLKFSFEGNYKGTLPQTKLIPEYDMILHFTVDQVTAN